MNTAEGRHDTMKYAAQMRVWLGILTLASLSLAGCASIGAANDGNNGLSNNEQYADYSIDDLDSYGTWITLPPYGSVWRPNVTADWAPFYYGHWDYTPPNWTWVSYEPFGWIVYHYGNWYYAPGYGWVWIPGNGQWSPARVEWATYDDFVCWAPLPPGGVILPRPWERYENVDIWSVVPARHFTDDDVGIHRLDRSFILPREQQSRIVSRVPDPRMIERSSGRPVPRINIPREPVRVGRQQMHRMHVPPPDQQRVDRHKAEVEQHVTRSTGNQRAAGNQRNTGSHR